VAVPYRYLSSLPSHLMKWNLFFEKFLPSETGALYGLKIKFQSCSLQPLPNSYLIDGCCSPTSNVFSPCKIDGTLAWDIVQTNAPTFDCSGYHSSFVDQLITSTTCDRSYVSLHSVKVQDMGETCLQLRIGWRYNCTSLHLPIHVLMKNSVWSGTKTQCYHPQISFLSR
jgi:hypothetical protein